MVRFEKGEEGDFEMGGFLIVDDVALRGERRYGRFDADEN